MIIKDSLSNTFVNSSLWVLSSLRLMTTEITVWYSSNENWVGASNKPESTQDEEKKKIRTNDDSIRAPASAHGAFQRLYFLRVVCYLSSLIDTPSDTQRHKLSSKAQRKVRWVKLGWCLMTRFANAPLGLSTKQLVEKQPLQGRESFLIIRRRKWGQTCYELFESKQQEGIVTSALKSWRVCEWDRVPRFATQEASTRYRSLAVDPSHTLKQRYGLPPTDTRARPQHSGP